MSTGGWMNARRAIEALRSGVPNRDAVAALGCEQPEIERRFREQLAAAKQGLKSASQAPGMLISGDFGTGKSHLLEHLQNIALHENFVCSKIVISKETPLYDPVKFYRAAADAAAVPGRRGAALTEVAIRLRPAEVAYATLEGWAQGPESGLSPVFAATLALFRHNGSDTELGDQIVSFWRGDQLNVRDIKKNLRTYSEHAPDKVGHVTRRELAIQRFRFVPRLMVAAGYAGWVLLVDEVELIGRYSPLQRGKAYGELARWLGLNEEQVFPGLVTVFAIMSNFESEVLEEKDDLDKIPAKLRAKDLEELALDAEAGMRALRRDRIPVAPPDAQALQRTHERIRAIHAEAHGWAPPMKEVVRGLSSMAMREHVKSWINEWDLQRLYPDYAPVTEVREEEVQMDYSENADLEGTVSEDPDEGGAPNT